MVNIWFQKVYVHTGVMVTVKNCIYSPVMEKIKNVLTTESG